MIQTLTSQVRFMTDSTEGQDGAKEVIMDYVVSWTLRNAQNCCSGKRLLFQYSRRLLGLFLGLDIKEEDIVIVETWKQYRRIDLWVFVSINGVQHDILIEDKYYSCLHDSQLLRYKEIFDDWLNEKRPHSQRHYLVLSCMDSSDPGNIIFNDSEFPVFYWDDMVRAMKCNDGAPSESEIFNEFWINWV